MDEIFIRRERGFAAISGTGAGRAERMSGARAGKADAGSEAQRISPRPTRDTALGITSDSARRAYQVQADSALLRTGESALAEAEGILHRLLSLQDCDEAERISLLQELDRVLSQTLPDGTELFTNSSADDAERINSALLEALEALSEKLPSSLSPDEALTELSGGLLTSFSELVSHLVSGTREELLELLTELLSSGTDGEPDSDAAALLAGASAGDGGAFKTLPSALDSGMSRDDGIPFTGAAGQDDVSPSSGAFRALAGIAENMPSSGDGSGRGTGGTDPGADFQGSGSSASGSLRLGDFPYNEAGINVRGSETLHTSLLLHDPSAEPGGSGLTGADSPDEGGHSAMSAGSQAVDGGGGESEVSASRGGAAASVRSAAVYGNAGELMESIDSMSSDLLSKFGDVIVLGLDGRWKRTDDVRETLRMWLAQETDPSNGHPVHTVTVLGRDRKGGAVLSGVYVQWEDESRTFREVSQYPNPFDVTGGEEGTDWLYEEDSQTLRIMTDLVTAIAGGVGVTADGSDFSGRIVIEDNLGDICLTLLGVECRVDAGSAFEIGRENHVTLLLADGTENVFRSGAGFAGISIADGAALVIDRALSGEDLPCGVLTAQGASGGAGIGRDCGGSWDRVSSLEIRGGTVHAIGGGAGAGIGSGKHGFFGSITITGGDILATGGPDGGAGIGGALGAPVGSITIRAGRIRAEASMHAAAIGAGIEGESGDILITGTARILSARGGDPGADIGACLFGSCGHVRVSGGADIGSASVSPASRDASYLTVGERRIAVPRFCVSSEALRLNGLKLETRGDVNALRAAADDALSRVSRIRKAYGALGGRLDEELRSLRGMEVVGSTQLIRDADSAGEVLTNARRALLQRVSQTLGVQSGHSADGLKELLR